MPVGYLLFEDKDKFPKSAIGAVCSLPCLKYSAQCEFFVLFLFLMYLCSLRSLMLLIIRTMCSYREDHVISAKICLM